MYQDDLDPTTHVVRGVLITLVAGPVALYGALLVVVAAVSMFLAGLNPANWFSGSAADWLFGIGVEGDAVNFVRFMVGGLLASSGWAAIRWGFYGSDR